MYRCDSERRNRGRVSSCSSDRQVLRLEEKQLPGHGPINDFCNFPRTTSTPQKRRNRGESESASPEIEDRESTILRSLFFANLRTDLTPKTLSGITGLQTARLVPSTAVAASVAILTAAVGFAHTFVRSASTDNSRSRNEMSDTASPPLQQAVSEEACPASLAQPVNLRISGIEGTDSNGKKYKTVAAMWKQELQGNLDDPKTGWYGKAIGYWEKQEASINGVLGGLPEVHDVDIKESKEFVESLGPSLGRVRALDCGAGIGRISKHLLCDLFESVDLMEPVPHMVEQARRDLAGRNVGEFIMTSMQKAQLPPQHYDVIWIQWAAIYLTDEDFVRFLQLCQRALRPGGAIIFKENVSDGKTAFIVDKDDSSLTRSDKHYKAIFQAAGVRVVKETRQKDWPANLFPIGVYALQ